MPIPYTADLPAPVPSALPSLVYPVDSRTCRNSRLTMTHSFALADSFTVQSMDSFKEWLIGMSI